MIAGSIAHAERLAAAAVPWLVCAVVVLLVAWFVLFCRQNGVLARCVAWFNGLTPLGKAVALVAVCLCTMWGGSKEGGDGDGGDRGAPAPGERSRSEIAAELGVSSQPWLSASYLNPLMKQGYIAQTLPQKPKSPLQRYRILRKGREVLA